MPSEAAVSSMIEGLMVLCKEKLQPGEVLSSIESEDSVRLSRSLKEGEAFMDDFHAVANSSSMWSSILKALEEDPLDVRVKSPLDASELAMSLSSHDQRLVGALLCCMELMVEINPANISFVVLSMHRIFGSQLAPSIILELLQNYRGHFPYSYMFIRRIGRSPKAPISVWKDALLSFEPASSSTSPVSLSNTASAKEEGKFKKSVSFSDLESPTASGQLHSVLSDDEVDAYSGPSYSYEDNRHGGIKGHGSADEEAPTLMHAPKATSSKISDWLVSDSEEGEDSDPDETAVEEEQARGHRLKPRFTRMSASPSRKPTDQEKEAQEIDAPVAPASTDIDLMDVEDLSFHDDIKPSAAPGKWSAAGPANKASASNRPTKSAESVDSWAQASKPSTSQSAAGGSARVTVVAKLPNASSAINHIGNLEDDISEEEPDHEDIIDKDDLRKEFDKVLVPGSSDVANKVSLGRKVRFVLGASVLADRISRCDSDGVSWTQVLQLAGLSSEKVTEGTVEKVPEEPAQQSARDIPILSNTGVPESKIKLVRPKPVEVKVRSLDVERTPELSLSFDTNLTTESAPAKEAISTDIIVVNSKDLTPDPTQSDSSSSLRGPVSPERLDKPRPMKTTSIVDDANKSTRHVSSKPAALPSPMTHVSPAALDPIIAARSIFASIDHNGDGIVSHIELIKALRGNPQLAKALKLPSSIRQEDGSRDSYMYSFATMDTDGSGSISQREFLDFIAKANMLASDAKSTQDKQEIGSKVLSNRPSESPIAAAKLAKRVGRHLDEKVATDLNSEKQVVALSSASTRPEKSRDVDTRRQKARGDGAAVLDKIREVRKRSEASSPSKVLRNRNAGSELDSSDNALRISRSDPMARNLRRVVGGEEYERLQLSDTLATTRSFPDSRASLKSTVSSSRDFAIPFPPAVPEVVSSNGPDSKKGDVVRPPRPSKTQGQNEAPYPFAMLNLPVSAMHLDNLSQLARSTGVLCEGYLEKKSHLLGMWQKRYFILARLEDGSAELQIYTKASPSAWGNIPLGLRRVIQMDHCDSIELIQDKKKIGTLFKLTERVYKGKSIMQRLLKKSNSTSNINVASTTAAHSSISNANSQPRLGSTGASGSSAASSDGASDAGSVVSDAELDGMRIVTIRAISAQVRHEWVTALRQEVSSNL